MYKKIKMKLIKAGLLLFILMGVSIAKKEMEMYETQLGQANTNQTMFIPLHLHTFDRDQRYQSWVANFTFGTYE